MIRKKLNKVGGAVAVIRRGFFGLAFCGLLLALGGCGYSLSPTPYGMMENMSVSVPVVVNQSRFTDLGPMLTHEMIRLLDSSDNITVRENAPARLKMEIKTVHIAGGAWRRDDDDDDTPTNSASRVIYLTVEAILERPNPEGGQPLVRRNVFNARRNFLVNEDQAQVDVMQNEAFQKLVADISQKIAQTLFSEF